MQLLELLQKEYDIEIFIGNSRVDNEESLVKEILKIQPDCIVSTIGRTHGIFNGKIYNSSDYLEQKGKLVENLRDNLYSPVLLAILSVKYNFHYVYIGTGCIFEYNESHQYGTEINGFTEESTPNFFDSSYSTVKGFTDMLMRQFESTTLNIRIRMPVSSKHSRGNFITKLIGYKKICSIPNSITVLDDLLPIIINMIKIKQTGTFNLTNPGLISNNEILEIYREVIDPDFTWENFTIDEQNNILDSKRANNYLNTSKIENLYHIDNIKDSVRNLFIRMKDGK